MIQPSVSAQKRLALERAEKPVNQVCISCFANILKLDWCLQMIERGTPVWPEEGYVAKTKTSKPNATKINRRPQTTRPLTGTMGTARGPPRPTRVADDPIRPGRRETQVRHSRNAPFYLCVWLFMLGGFDRCGLRPLGASAGVPWASGAVSSSTQALRGALRTRFGRRWWRRPLLSGRNWPKLKWLSQWFIVFGAPSARATTERGADFLTRWLGGDADAVPNQRRHSRVERDAAALAPWPTKNTNIAVILPDYRSIWPSLDQPEVVFQDFCKQCTKLPLEGFHDPHSKSIFSS